jgi:hypothetical protein
MKEFLENALKNIVGIESELSTVNENATTYRPAIDKWSANEILGHLIDSAINNQRRFVLMQLQNNLIFEGYDQDKWVQMQQYWQRDWKDLLNTWAVLNKNIVFILENVNPGLWQRNFSVHNLHKIAWQKVPENEPAMISYFVKDYFGHIVHHMKQIYRQLDLNFILHF